MKSTATKRPRVPAHRTPSDGPTLYELFPIQHRFGVERQVAVFFLNQLGEANPFLEHFPQVEAIHDDDRFGRILLEQRDGVVGHAVDRQEQAHHATARPEQLTV